MKRLQGRSSDALIHIGSTATVLALLLMQIRGKIAFGWHLRNPAKLANVALNLPAAAYEDLAYVVLLTAPFALGVVLARGRPRMQLALRTGYTVLALFSLLVAIVNVTAVADLGRPLNYQWLYYSDFLLSLDAYNAMGALLSRSWLVGTATMAAALLLLSYALTVGLRRAANGPRFPGLISAVAVALCLYVGLGARWAPSPPRDRAKVANPVLAFVGSLFTADAAPPLATRPTSIGPEDFLPVAQRPAAAAGPRPFAGKAEKAGVRNVLVVVLESVGAAYLDLYGSRFGATPELSRYGSHARVFTNAYAQVPGTTYSLVSLLLSIYPKHSFRSITREYPRIRAPSLSGELDRRGYRTAFLNAGENRFQRGDVFLGGRGFDQVLDAEAFPCTDAEVASKGRDACLAAGFTRWLDASADRPFFAALWTIQTHYPYLIAGATRPFGVRDTMFNRYLNALQQSDRALGEIMNALEARGVLDSTLVVVVGDHGEAFGQHGQIAHRLLYQEDIHVPLLLINRRLFHGETDSVLGGMIDIAPTILDLLGYPLPGLWQGRSLFDSDRSGRVYFFGPYSGLFGYRDGQRKLIYHALGDVAELYDLGSDPGEKVDLAPSSPEAVQLGRDRLAAWVQFQDRFLEPRLVPEAR